LPEAHHSRQAEAGDAVAIKVLIKSAADEWSVNPIDSGWHGTAADPGKTSGAKSGAFYLGNGWKCCFRRCNRLCEKLCFSAQLLK
jgi:hypothetical protein